MILWKRSFHSRLGEIFSQPGFGVTSHGRSSCEVCKGVRRTFDHLYVDTTTAPAQPRDIRQVIELAQPRLSSDRFGRRHLEYQDGKASRRQASSTV